MRYEAAEVTAYNAVPCRAFTVVELFTAVSLENARARTAGG